MEKTKELVNGEIVDVVKISKYLSLDMIGEEPNKHTEVDDVHNETIYWEWPYQTELDDGTGNKTLQAGDVQDTSDQGKIVMMNIVARGIQVTKNPAENLAKVAKVGDYVNYNANSNGTYTKTGEIMAGVTIKDNQTFTTAESVKWRILSIDPATQKVTLMAEDPILKTGSTTEYKNVTLSGINGYKNVEEGLDELGSIYGQGKGADSGRSINIDDIMQYSNFDPATQYSNSDSSNGTVGGTRTYTSGKFIKGETYNGEPVVKVPEGVTETENADGTISASSVTVTQTFYDTKNEATTRASFTGKDAENGGKIYNMIFKKAGSTTADKPTYWLASRCVNLGSSGCYFLARLVFSGYVRNCIGLLGSEVRTNSPACAFVPVVTLKSKIQTTGQNERSVAVESRLKNKRRGVLDRKAKRGIAEHIARGEAERYVYG